MRNKITSGVERSDVVDIVSHDPKTDEVTLTMVEERPWGQYSNQLRQLEEKLNNYLIFALNGQLQRQYPHFTGKPLRIRLYCRFSPNEAALRFLEQVEAALAVERVAFEIKSWE